MFKKGNTEGKGRPKGSPNKLDTEARELFVMTLGKHSKKLDSAFDKVYHEDPIKFLELFSKYAQYFAPKMTENVDKVTHEYEGFDIRDIINFDDKPTPEI